MLDRRLFLTSLAVAAAGMSPTLHAQNWRAAYPQLVYASIQSGQSAVTNDRLKDFMAYLSDAIGVPVQMKSYPDYKGVMEGLQSGEVQIASMGAASYARARMNGVAVSPFAVGVSAGGTRGYYSVFYVKASSPYRRIEDLKGRSVAFVDPDSTSGNIVPRLALHNLKIKPEEFFGKIVNTGTHEKAVTLLATGEVDVAANAWTAEGNSIMHRVAATGAVRAEDFRIIYRSEQIVNGPVVYPDRLPQALKDRIAQAFFEAPTKGQAAFEKAYGKQVESFEPIEHAAYLPVIELNRFTDSLK